MAVGNALKPARAKAHKPYPAGSDHQNYTIITVAGGEKGTGVHLVRYYYYSNPLATEPCMRFRTRSNVAITPVAIRAKLSEAVARYGYTITTWPKELRP